MPLMKFDALTKPSHSYSFRGGATLHVGCCQARSGEETVVRKNWPKVGISPPRGRELP